jgi:hypothetical protein
MMEQIEVCLQQAIERVQAGQVERLQKRVFAVILLDVLVDARALLLRVKLGRSGHHQRLVGARGLAVVDWRHRAHHGGVRREGAWCAQSVAAVHRLEGRR